MIRKPNQMKSVDSTKFKPIMKPISIKPDKEFAEMMKHAEDMRSLDQDMDPVERSRKLLAQDKDA